MKDALGHGSNPRGGADAAHRAARRAVQLHPDSPPAEALAVLRSRGYQPTDIQRLRELAGGQISAAHQAGVELAVPRGRTLANPNIPTDLLKRAAGLH